ncbi:hypothetical protein Tco_0454983 [Tanacetum coccineum]
MSSKMKFEKLLDAGYDFTPISSDSPHGKAHKEDIPLHAVNQKDETANGFKVASLLGCTSLFSVDPGIDASSQGALQEETSLQQHGCKKTLRRRQYREYIVRNQVVLKADDTIDEFGWDNKHAGINVLLLKHEKNRARSCFEVVMVYGQSSVVDAQSEVVVVDVGTPMGSHPCLKHEGYKVVNFLMEVLEVDFDGAFGGKRYLSLGVGECDLLFSHDGDLVVLCVILDDKCDQNEVKDGDYKVKVM